MDGGSIGGFVADECDGWIGDIGGESASGLWQAVWMILVADITMSLDNVLAVAGAARNHFGLMLFGLALSIPLVVFASNLMPLSELVDTAKSLGQNTALLRIETQRSA